MKKNSVLFIVFVSMFVLAMAFVSCKKAVPSAPDFNTPVAGTFTPTLAVNTPTITMTYTAENTATNTIVYSPTNTPSITMTSTASDTATSTATATQTNSPVNTDTATATATVTITPIVTHSVIFHANGGSGFMTDQVINQGSSANLSANTFTNTGYEFVGWALSATGGVVYNDGQNFLMGSSDVDLYAVWAVAGNLFYRYNFDQQDCSDSSGNGIAGIDFNITYAPDGNGGYAASFNGGTSYIAISNNSVRGMSEFTVMMRFKASPGQYGALFGYQNTAVGTTPTEYIPMITIRSDGLLYGSLWTGTDLIVMSSAPVNDGQWHTVYFSVKPSSIALYLDGTQIGINTGTVQHLGMIYNQIGTADTAGRAYQPDANGGNNFWYYYNGHIDDFAFYMSALH